MVSLKQTLQLECILRSNLGIVENMSSLKLNNQLPSEWLSVDT